MSRLSNVSAGVDGRMKYQMPRQCWQFAGFRWRAIFYTLLSSAFTQLNISIYVLAAVGYGLPPARLQKAKLLAA